LLAVNLPGNANCLRLGRRRRDRAGARGAINWTSDHQFELGGQRFALESGETLGATRSTTDRFVLGKVPSMVDRFVAQNSGRSDARHVVELGIFQGGSVALIQEVCRPQRLVAIDLNPEPVAPLEAYIDGHGLRDVIRLYYGIDQADRARIAAIVAAEFGDAPLDLVIDDASHFYQPTRSSFETLFPLLREGGRYVIEDWDWAHYPEEMWQSDGGMWADEPALTNLILELLMLAGTRPDIISEIAITRSLAEISRGPAQLDAPIELSRLYAARGLEFRPIL
jgi:hypothetical protein